MANMLHLETLKLFCDLVETHSFSRAADKNFVSQSAVSQRLRALEREYGQTLLDRGQGRGTVTPTAAGRLLYEGAKRLLREAGALDAQLRGLSTRSPARCGSPPSTRSACTRCRRASSPSWPRTRASTSIWNTSRPATSTRTWRRGRWTSASSPARRPGADIEVIPFAEEDMALVCAPEHPLARQPRSRCAIWTASPSSASPTTSRRASWWTTACARPASASAWSTTFDNIETIKNLVEIGSGVCILPADTVRQEVGSGILAASLSPRRRLPPPDGPADQEDRGPGGRRCGRSWRRCGENPSRTHPRTRTRLSEHGEENGSADQQHGDRENQEREHLPAPPVHQGFDAPPGRECEAERHGGTRQAIRIRCHGLRKSGLEPEAQEGRRKMQSDKPDPFSRRTFCQPAFRCFARSSRSSLAIEGWPTSGGGGQTDAGGSVLRGLISASHMATTTTDDAAAQSGWSRTRRRELSEAARTQGRHPS